ncbi:MAG: hypothetical protein H0T18_00120 [Chloroflexia bacterium]|nr:hypothetical protein [Chloroflexia bacterium]
MRSLHLIEPPLLDLLPQDPRIQTMDTTVRRIQLSHGDSGDEATTEAFFAMLGAGHIPERLRGTPEWDQLVQHANRFSRSEPAGDYPSAALQRLPRSLPVALYSGGRSHPALRAIVRELAARIEGSRVTDIASAGHAVQMAGAAFVDPLLASTTEADALWNKRTSAQVADTAGK